MDNVRGDSIKIATPRTGEDFSMTDTNMVIENDFQKIMQDAQ